MTPKPTYEELEQKIRVLEEEITKDKQALEDSWEREEKYRQLAATAHDAIATVDFEGIITYANPAAQDLAGGMKIIGRPLQDFIPPDLIDKHVEMLNARRQGYAETISYEWTLKSSKNNSLIFIDITSSLLLYKSKPSEVLFIGRDITERKRAEETIRNSQHQLSDIIEFLPDATLVIDKNDKVIAWNRAIEAMTGIKAEDMLGKGNYEYAIPFYGERRPTLIDMVLHPLPDMESKYTEIEQKKNILHGESYAPNLPGGKAYLAATASVLQDANGEIIAAIECIRDNTERKALEKDRQQSLERMRKTLRATVQAIGSLVEARDPYTAGHQRHVADIARTIAKEMGLSNDRIDGLRMACTMHDIGKISVPSEILTMPRKLSTLEVSLIRTHAQSGYDILKDIEFPWPIARIVLEHHERMGGSGYPNGVTGDNLLLESRILAVADVVEAMATHRPYRPSLGLNAALEEITQNKGVLYDPTVVDACLRIFNEHGYRIKD